MVEIGTSFIPDNKHYNVNINPIYILCFVLTIIVIAVFFTADKTKINSQTSIIVFTSVAIVLVIVLLIAKPTAQSSNGTSLLSSNTIQGGFVIPTGQRHVEHYNRTFSFIGFVIIDYMIGGILAYALIQQYKNKQIESKRDKTIYGIKWSCLILFMGILLPYIAFKLTHNITGTLAGRIVL